jgi:hypothetical protein
VSFCAYTVVKHEAMAVRRGRSELVAPDDLDYDRHEALHVSSPEERALSADRATRAAEALQRLKPDELRAMWLKAMGNSYAQIAETTGWSATKVNRALAEGRKRFLERFDGIETGAECQRWHPVLSAMVDGEASAAEVAELRPHLRNCPGCRATLKGLHKSERSLAAVLPVSLLGAGMKLGGLLERVLPSAAAADGGGAAGAGGLSLLGIGGAKLAGLLAAGAAASAGGGLVIAGQAHHRASLRNAVPATRPAATAGVSASQAVRTPGGVAQPDHVRVAPRRSGAERRLVARRHRPGGRLEFAPAGREVAAAADAAVTRPQVTPQMATTSTRIAPRSVPITPAGADATRGEFAPQP